METLNPAKPTIKAQAGKIKGQLDEAIGLLQSLKRRHQDNPEETEELNQHVATLSSAKEYVQKVYLNPSLQTPNLDDTLSDFEDIAEDLVNTLGGRKVSLRILKGRISGVKDVVTALKMQFPGNFLEVNNNTLERGVGINGVVGEWDATLRMFQKVEGNKATDGIQINGFLKGNADAINKMFVATQPFTKRLGEENDVFRKNDKESGQQ
ncbi:hypothetical protein FPOAC2_04223 [Fusarium poae]|jgi:hypothetical protein